MKVDMKNLPDEKQKPKFGKKQTAPAKKLFGRKKQDEEPVEEPVEEEDSIEEEETEDESSASEGTGNIYRDNFNMYKEQYSKKLKDANLLQNNKFWIAVIVVLFFVFLSVNSNTSRARNQLTVQLNRTVNEIEKLNTAVTDLKAELEEQARIDSIVLSNEEEELARNDAKVQGAFVASLQNKFNSVSLELAKINRDLDEVGDNEERYNELIGKQKKLIEQKDNIKKELDPYFNDGAKRTGKGQWYSYMTTGIPGEWEFASNASFKGDTMKVLWFLYTNDPENPKDHSLLAYCTAVYHASDGLFYDVDVKTTTYADANGSKYDNEEEYVPNSSELSIMEQLQQMAGDFDPSTPPADEEYTNEATATRDDYKKKVLNGEIEGEEVDQGYRPGLGDSEEDAEEVDSERSE